ncbi:MAG: M48 family metallopeptidase [Clostridiales bacterium]|nr:M48 family metallopeptidase [Clostridiales bacterium]
MYRECYQHKFSQSPSDVRVRDQKKRWGSCTAFYSIGGV